MRARHLGDRSSASFVAPLGLSPRRFLLGVAGVLLGAHVIGCEGDTTAPAAGDVLAVFANLYVGQPVNGESAVLVTRVRPVLDAYDPEEAAVRDAVVVLRRQGQAAAETLRMGDPGHYTSANVVIEARTTYELEVVVSGFDRIRAETTTPDTLAFFREPRPLPGTMHHEDIPDSFPVVIGCEAPRQILLVDVYCREEWEDARYLEPFAGHDQPDDYTEYGGDNGEPRHIFAYMRFEDLERDGEGRRLVNFYDAMMVFWGRHRVSVAAIDDNTYNYLYRDHPEENGGIRGGIGLFGSAHRRAYEVEIVE